MKKIDPAVLEQRVEVLRRALKSDPKDDVARYGLGRALLQLGRYGEAQGEFRRLLELRADYTAAHRELGRALLLAGQASDARTALERGRRLAEETGDLQAGREIQVLLKRAGRLERSDRGP